MLNGHPWRVLKRSRHAILGAWLQQCDRDAEVAQEAISTMLRSVRSIDELAGQLCALYIQKHNHGLFSFNETSAKMLHLVCEMLYEDARPSAFPLNARVASLVTTLMINFGDCAETAAPAKLCCLLFAFGPRAWKPSDVPTDATAGFGRRCEDMWASIVRQLDVRRLGLDRHFVQVINPIVLDAMRLTQCSFARHDDGYCTISPPPAGSIVGAGPMPNIPSPPQLIAADAAIPLPPPRVRARRSKKRRALRRKRQRT